MINNEQIQQATDIPTPVQLATSSPYLTAKEAAEYLRMSYSTFRKKARLIKMMPGTHKYRREDLDEYAQSNRRRILR
jgi:excisionase family DNA binding protein